MSEKEYSWTIKLDWLNILNSLEFTSIDEIPELKRDKTIKKLTKTFGNETLLELDPSELENLVVNELRDVMKKELIIKQKTEERIQNEMRNKFIPFKQGGIIKIDPRDFKDLDVDSEKPEDILKAIYKKLVGEKDEDEEKDEDKNKYEEDSTGYYI